MIWLKNRRFRVLLCASGVSFMIMLDSNIVAVSLPSIARDLNAPFVDIEWVISAYVLTFAAGLIPAGALADRYGRRRLLLIGLFLFTAASLACGSAPEVGVLNAARAVQGIGAAIQLSAALAVLGHEFQGVERARAFGFWGTVLGVAVTAGPVVGGFITSNFGWRWAFLVNIPTGFALIATALKDVEESRDFAAVRLDIPGMICFGFSLFFLVWGLIDANVDGWLSAPTIAKFAVASACLTFFVIVERAQTRPMVDLDLFRKSTFLGASVAMLGYAASAQVMVTYLPLYLQNVFFLGPASTGLAMMPYAVPILFCPQLAAALASRISGRTLLTAGLTIVAVGNLLTGVLAILHMPYPIVALGMLLTGSGAGVLNGETVKVSMSVVSPQRGGMASGIGSSLRFIGILLGFAGLGAVLTSGTQHRFSELSASLAPVSDDRNVISFVVSHIVAGDIESVLGGMQPQTQARLREMSRLSFESGFASLLIAAGAISGLSALLTYRLVCAQETAPVREHDQLAVKSEM